MRANTQALPKSVQRKHRLAGTIWKNKNIYIILAPVLLYYLIFCYVPMFGASIAFKDYSVTRGFMDSPWVGLKHFKAFLGNYQFWGLLRNTLTINIYGLLFGFPSAIILALLLNEVRCSRFKKTVQTITYMPHFISTVVVAGMILDFVASDGVINSLRGLFGLEKIAFMTAAEYFCPIYIISDIWQEIGWSSIIYIAALSSIDMELYEAAAIDGAGRWRQLWNVTLPGIMPTVVIMLILRIGQMLSIGFEKIMLLYNPSIYETADVISTYVYRMGILNLNYSYSAAVGLFNSVVNFILLVMANTLSKRLTGSGLW